MQPTRNQVEQSLAALALAHESNGICPAGPASRPAGTDAELVALAIGSLPEGLLAQLEQTVDIRQDRLELARAHLEHFSELTADELADRIVGRLVCDRLR